MIDSRTGAIGKGFWIKFYDGDLYAGAEALEEAIEITTNGWSKMIPDRDSRLPLSPSYT